MKKTTQPKKRPQHRAQQISAEQLQTLTLLKQNGYSAQALQALMFFIGQPDLEDWVTDIDALIGGYLANAQTISGTQVTALYKLFNFNRILAQQSGKL